MSREFLTRERERAFTARATVDCHWGPCSDCGAPDATDFPCDTAGDGPRQLLVGFERGEDGVVGGDGPVTEGRNEGGAAIGGRPARWRFVGPPGEARVSASGPQAWPLAGDEASADEASADEASADGAPDANVSGGGRGAAWPYDLLGTPMQSKNASLNGLALLVEAAGGEKGG